MTITMPAAARGAAVEESVGVTPEVLEILEALATPGARREGAAGRLAGTRGKEREDARGAAKVEAQEAAWVEAPARARGPRTAAARAPVAAGTPLVRLVRVA